MRAMNKFWSIAITLFLVIVLTGCTALAGKALGSAKSVTQAGVNTVVVEPVAIGDQVARRYQFDLGKECAKCTADVQFNDDGGIKSVKVDFTGVTAFQGQAQATAAIVAVQRELKEAGIENAAAIQAITAEVMKAFIPLPVP